MKKSLKTKARWGAVSRMKHFSRQGLLWILIGVIANSESPRAQSQAGQVAGAVTGGLMQVSNALGQVFGNGNAQFTLSQSATTLQAQMLACDAENLVDQLSGLVTKTGSQQTALDKINKTLESVKNPSSTAKEGSKCTNPNYTWKESDCSVDCSQPSMKESYTCSDVLSSVPTENEHKDIQCWTNDNQGNLSPTQAGEIIKGKVGPITAYKNYLNFKSSKCSMKALNDVKKFRKVFECQKQVMSKAIQQAQKEYDQFYNQAQGQLGQMMQAVSELNAQNAQIEDLLGPDGQTDRFAGKGGQFGGLIQMLEETEQAINKMEADQTSVVNQLSDLDQEAERIEQSLEADSASQLAACIDGSSSTSRVFLCPAPETTQGADGKPIPNGARRTAVACGLSDYLAAKAGDSSVRTGGRVTEQELANINSLRAEYQAAVEQMKNLMGANPQLKQAGVQKNPDQEIKKIAARLGALSAKRMEDASLNSWITQTIQTSMQSCSRVATNYKNGVANNPNSDYRKSKQKLKTDREGVSAGVRNQMRELKKNYANIMSRLGNRHVALNTQSCTDSDTTKVEKCFKDIRGALTNLMEGGGPMTQTAFPIRGGALIPGQMIKCNGLRGCVSQLRVVREQQRKMITEGQQKAQNFAGQAKQQLATQISGGPGGSGFAQILQGLQNNLKNTFAGMGAAIRNAGVETEVESLKNLESETLEDPQTQPNIGGRPKDFSKYLSGAMGGLVDLNDTGVKDYEKAMISAANEKREALSEKIKLATNAESSMSGLKCINPKKYCPYEKEDSVGGVACTGLSPAYKECVAAVSGSKNGVEVNQLFSDLANDLASVQRGSAGSSSAIMNLKKLTHAEAACAPLQTEYVMCEAENKKALESQSQNRGQKSEKGK